MACSSGVLGGKSSDKILSSPASRKADLRKEISGWKLLVWAYADERARFANFSVPAKLPEPPRSYSNLAVDGLDMMVDASSPWVSAVDVHEDALQIDAITLRWLGGDYHRRDVIARAAERRVPLPPASSLPPLHFTPRLKANGKPDMLYAPGGHQALACWVEEQGTPPDQWQWHHETHCLFLALLDHLRGYAFTSWRVVRAG